MNSELPALLVMALTDKETSLEIWAQLTEHVTMLLTQFKDSKEEQKGQTHGLATSEASAAPVGGRVLSCLATWKRRASNRDRVGIRSTVLSPSSCETVGKRFDL